MYRLAICDDEANTLNVIASLIEEYKTEKNFSFEYTLFQTGMDLISSLEKGNLFDIYCLDIVMPKLDGIKLGKEIRTYDQSAPILYFTSSPEFALDSYSVKASNYILKPITKETFFAALNDTLEQMEKSKESSITIRDNEGIKKILLSNLVYAEAMGRRVVYHLSTGRTIECIHQFSKACETLSAYSYFIKPHRSYMVNMNYIDTIKTTQIDLQIGVSIPIAQGRTKEIKDLYLALQMERN